MIPIPKSLRWSWKIKPAPIPKPRLLHTALTLEEWLSSESRVDYARRLYQDRNFRALLSVIHNEIPIPNPAAKPEALAGMAMYCSGYMRALNLLLSMAVPPELATPPPEADYSSPQEELADDDIG